MRGFSGGNAAYLGVPLLLLLLALVLRVRGRGTTLGLPWSPFDPLPVIANLIPSRLAMYTALFTGLLLAVFLEAVWRSGGCRRGLSPWSCPSPIAGPPR